MLKKIKLSLVLGVLTLFFSSVLLLCQILGFQVLLFAFYLGAFYSPLAIILLLVDLIFNKSINKKYFYIALFLNIAYIFSTIYFALQYAKDFSNLII